MLSLYQKNNNRAFTNTIRSLQADIKELKKDRQEYINRQVALKRIHSGACKAYHAQSKVVRISDKVVKRVKKEVA